MVKKFILLLLCILFAVQLYDWFSCTDFKPDYHLSIYRIHLASDNLIHNDINTPLILVRFYHNKIILFLTSVYTSFLLFWDIKFLVNLVLLTGVVGLFCGFWYVRTILDSGWFPKLIFTLMVIFPLSEIILKPAVGFPLKIVLYSLPFGLYSLLGMEKFMEEKNSQKTYIFVILVILFTVWWQIVLPRDFRNYCI